MGECLKMTISVFELLWSNGDQITQELKDASCYKVALLYMSLGLDQTSFLSFSLLQSTLCNCHLTKCNIAIHTC